MGEVIKGPWDRQGQNEPSDPDGQLHPAINLEHLTALVKAVTAYIRQRPLLQRNIADRQRDLSGVNDEALIARVNGSVAADWSTHPAYFAACINELQARRLMRRAPRDPGEAE